MHFSHIVRNIDGAVVLWIFDLAVNNRLLSEILAFNLETAAPIASFMLILNGISHSISQEIQEIGREPHFLLVFVGPMDDLVG